MFLRFLGRIYLYLVVLPAIAPFLKRVLKNVLTDVVVRQQSSMTSEQRERFDRITRNMTSPPRRPSTPMGFQAQSRQHR